MSAAPSPHSSSPPGRRRLRVALAAAAAFALVPGLFAIVRSSQAAAAATPTARAPSAVPAPPTGWSTVFSDDFTGAANTGLDTSKWLYDLGTSYPGGAGTGAPARWRARPTARRTCSRTAAATW